MRRILKISLILACTLIVGACQDRPERKNLVRLSGYILSMKTGLIIFYEKPSNDSALGISIREEKLPKLLKEWRDVKGETCLGRLYKGKIYGERISKSIFKVYDMYDVNRQNKRDLDVFLKNINSNVLNSTIICDSGNSSGK